MNYKEEVLIYGTIKTNPKASETQIAGKVRKKLKMPKAEMPIILNKIYIYL